MNDKKYLELEAIERKVREEYPRSKYKGLCEVVFGFEMHKEFLKSEGAQDALGRENAEMEALKIDQALALRRAEKKFLEELLVKEE